MRGTSRSSTTCTKRSSIAYTTSAIAGGSRAAATGYLEIQGTLPIGTALTVTFELAKAVDGAALGAARALKADRVFLDFDHAARAAYEERAGRS